MRTSHECLHFTAANNDADYEVKSFAHDLQQRVSSSYNDLLFKYHYCNYFNELGQKVDPEWKVDVM